MESVVTPKRFAKSSRDREINDASNGSDGKELPRVGVGTLSPESSEVGVTVRVGGGVVGVLVGATIGVKVGGAVGESVGAGVSDGSGVIEGESVAVD